MKHFLVDQPLTPSSKPTCVCLCKNGLGYYSPVCHLLGSLPASLFGVLATIFFWKQSVHLNCPHPSVPSVSPFIPVSATVVFLLFLQNLYTVYEALLS